MKRYAAQFIKSPTSYPLTAVYSAGVVLAVATSEQYVALSAGLLMFTLVTILAIFYALMREMKGVRRQLAVAQVAASKQSIEFSIRIDELVAALVEAGVEIPSHPAKGKP